MRRLFPVLLLAPLAHAQEPEAIPEVPEVMRFALERPRPTPPPCTGPLRVDATPCQVAFTVGTLGLWTVLQALQPADARLVRAADTNPFGEGRDPLRGPATTEDGLLLGGWRSDPDFVGLGSFDLRIDPQATRPSR